MGTSKSIADLPIGTYLVNSMHGDVDTDYELMDAYEVAEITTRGPRPVIYWGAVSDYGDLWDKHSPVWSIALVPDTSDHDTMLAFLTAAQLGEPNYDMIEPIVRAARAYEQREIKWASPNL